MDSQCSVPHTLKIAEFLPRWKFVGRQLGLSEQQLDDLKAQYPEPKEMRGEMLAKWVATSGPRATYRKLYDILVELEEGDAAEKVRRLVERPSGDMHGLLPRQAVPPARPCNDRIAPSNIQEVCTVLQQVIEWTPIGYNLNIPDHVIANIESDSTLCNMQARKRAMLQYWLNNDPNASWSALANALDGSYSLLAGQIRQRYYGAGGQERGGLCEELPLKRNASLSLDSEPVLADLLDRIATSIPSKYEIVGLQLGLQLSELHALRPNYSSLGNCYQAFSQIFDLWRRRGTSPYTWRTIIDVLRRPAVDEASLAKDLTSWIAQRK